VLTNAKSLTLQHNQATIKDLREWAWELENLEGYTYAFWANMTMILAYNLEAEYSSHVVVTGDYSVKTRGGDVWEIRLDGVQSALTVGDEYHGGEIDRITAIGDSSKNGFVLHITHKTWQK